MIENILDASAILAVLYNETGKEKVEPILEKSAVTADRNWARLNFCKIEVIR